MAIGANLARSGHPVRVPFAPCSDAGFRRRIEPANDGDVSFEPRAVWGEAAPYPLRLRQVPPSLAGRLDMLICLGAASKAHAEDRISDLVMKIRRIEADVVRRRSFLTTSPIWSSAHGGMSRLVSPGTKN